ncbi:MgtC/SapB family protein [Dysosmobacter acutus]|uniref:MgtC/SapB family protein n=1 Tax=Dysosmobacter acutus TaxID=2841504 RepID=UPI001F4C86F7|nr:MgtC/SapB family protein [Dysosmobacter acutus]
MRLTLAVVFGGIIGMDREHKRRPAGFRTYMLVCLGAALTMVLSQYEELMLRTEWADAFDAVGVKTDVTRFGAQVINGIGFLGTGTILVTGQREVKGLTTAAGLWASACMGLAIGAGFYECMLLGFVAIFLSIRLFPCIEDLAMANSRNMNLYVEFVSLERMGEFISEIKARGIRIFDVEIERSMDHRHLQHSSAVFYLYLPKKQSHTQLVTSLSCCPDVYAIDEI